MPITQDRMISVITAGLDYRQALRRAILVIRNSVATSPSDELIHLENIISESNLLKRPIQSSEILSIEDQHYRKEHLKNLRKRQSMTNKRREQGIPEKTIHPKSLMDLVEATELEKAQSALPKEPDMQNHPLYIQMRKQFPGMEPERFARLFKEALATEPHAPAKDIPVKETPIIRPKGQKAPVMTGPKNAPGLYDDDEPEAGPLIPIPEGEE